MFDRLFRGFSSAFSTFEDLFGFGGKTTGRYSGSQSDLSGMFNDRTSFGENTSRSATTLGTGGMGNTANFSSGPAELQQYDVGTQNWLNQILATDPHTNELFRRAYQTFDKPVPGMGTEFQDKMLGVGRQQADLQAQNISNTLASRGGGGLGTATTVGAQARAAAATEGLEKGIQGDIQKYGMDMQRYQAEHEVYREDRRQLLDALTFKYNQLQNIMSGHLGERGQSLQYVGQREQTQAGLEAAQWQAMADVGSSIAGMFSFKF